MGPFVGLNGALFSISLFMLTVVINAKSAPFGALSLFLARADYSQSRITLPDMPLRMMSKPCWKSSTLKW